MISKPNKLQCVSSDYYSICWHNSEHGCTEARRCGHLSAAWDRNLPPAEYKPAQVGERPATSSDEPYEIKNGHILKTLKHNT